MSQIKLTRTLSSKDAALGVDTLGASLSFACAVHCAFQPVLLAILPLFGMGFLLNEQLETVFLAFSIVMASLSLIQSWKHHRQPQAFPALILASLLILASRVPAWEPYEMQLAVSGALGIMSSHLLNMWLHKRVHPEHHVHAPVAEAETKALTLPLDLNLDLKKTIDTTPSSFAA